MRTKKIEVIIIILSTLNEAQHDEGQKIRTVALMHPIAVTAVEAQSRHGIRYIKYNRSDKYRA